MALAWKNHGVLPVAGGYLDQPATIMNDINTVLVEVKERADKTEEAAEVARAFAEQTTHPNIPLPKIPKELLDV
jgi:hypothetical protein